MRSSVASALGSTRTPRPEPRGAAPRESKDTAQARFQVSGPGSKIHEPRLGGRGHAAIASGYAPAGRDPRQHVAAMGGRQDDPPPRRAAPRLRGSAGGAYRAGGDRPDAELH